MYATSHKKPFFPVGGFGLLCKGRGQSSFSETSAKVTNWVTDPLDGCVSFCERFVVTGR